MHVNIQFHSEKRRSCLKIVNDHEKLMSALLLTEHYCIDKIKIEFDSES